MRKPFFSGMILVCAFHLLGCATTPQFKSPVIPIATPVVMQYRPYSATETSEINVWIDGRENEPRWSAHAVCEVNPTETSSGFSLVRSCKSKSSDGSEDKKQISMQFSKSGECLKYDSIKNPTTSAYSIPKLHIKTLEEKNEEAFDKIIGKLTAIYTIRNPVLSNHSIFKIDIVDSVKLDGATVPVKIMCNETVNGWSVYEERRVLVTKIIISISFDIKKEGSITINGEGYKLYEPNTMAILSSQLKGSLVVDIKGKGSMPIARADWITATVLK